MKKMNMFLLLSSGALLASCGCSPQTSSAATGLNPSSSSQPSSASQSSEPSSVSQSSAPSSEPEVSESSSEPEVSESSDESEVSESSDESLASEDSSGEQTFTLYLKTASWWAEDNARSGIYLWHNTKNTTNAQWPGEVMENVSDSVWKFTLEDPSLYTHLIFTRLSPTDISDWGAKTIDLAIADIDLNNPLYDISSQTTPIWGDPGVAGNWVAYNA